MGIPSPTMELRGGAKRERLSADDAAAAAAAGEDRLSALPNDLIVLILLKLDTRAAARTSALSRYWRHIWALLPALSFTEAPDPHWLRDVLDAHQVPVGDLRVETHGATPGSLAVWLPAAARRVSGDLFLSNHGAEQEEQQAFEFPCFEKATSIKLSGFQGLAVAPTGVFTRLTELYLSRVWFHGPGELGDAVSSLRCPCLQRLAVSDTYGLHDLTIHSKSLLRVQLKDLSALSQLNIVAQALLELSVQLCFRKSQPVANISAPQLTDLDWIDNYDPSTVHFGKIEHLRSLATGFYIVYGTENMIPNQSCSSLLQRFEGISINCLSLPLMCPRDIENYQYLMEDMAVLPDITFLYLVVMANGHAFEASAFHVLRLCTGIKHLLLHLLADGSEAQAVCSSDCICVQLQPGEWETEELLFDQLEEVEIRGWRGTEHEITFVKRLFDSGTKLKEMTVICNRSISKVEAKELYQIFQSICRPGVCMKFYLDQVDSKVLYAPKD